jgi:hypothetical protein
MTRLIFGLAAALLTASPAAADVHITMQDGRVSIVAREATVRQILTEWARVGQTKIVNVERIPGGPVTIELKSVTETQALDVLLRPLSGYILAPRAAVGANMSIFDRIIIMPTLAAARQIVPASSGQPPPPAMLQPAPPFQPPIEDADDQPGPDPDERPAAATPAIASQTNGVPVLNPFPAHSQEVAPQGIIPGAGVPPRPTAAQGPVAPRAPSAPAGGVSVPGMVAAPQPPQPKQNQPPGAPGRPVRPPGGQ